MATEMAFLGKWALLYTGQFIQLGNPGGSIVAAQAATPDQSVPDQRFNLYGDLAAGFWLQANNGMYVTFRNNTYVADQKRSEAPNRFSLEESGYSLRLVDHGPAPESGPLYYVNVVGSNVGRIARGENPPATTLLTQQIVTPGLAEIQQQGAIMAADLSWVCLSGADLKQVNFSGCNLTNADLSGAILTGAAFMGRETNLAAADFSFATLSRATMAEAIMTRAVLSRAQLDHAELSGARLDGADLSGANLTDAGLINTVLTDAYMAGANLTAAVLTSAHLDRADLSTADFAKATLFSTVLAGAALIGALLPKVDLTTATIDEATNFTGAQMPDAILNNCALQNVTFAHADLTRARLDGTDLSGADLSYANLTEASLQHGVKLQGASLSNATLTGADLTGAQLGAKTEAFQLKAPLLSDLNGAGLTGGIRAAFQAAGHPISADAAVSIRSEGKEWAVADHEHRYTVTNDGNRLNVWLHGRASDAAVMAGAYLPNAVLTSANLCAVNMAGVNLYGDQARLDNADLEDANLENANLSGMDFTQARMYGCNLSFANLVSANFSGAVLRPSINRKQVSLAFASLQGADFSQAQLPDAVLTNAAVSLNEGPFFPLDPSCIADLDSGKITPALRRQFDKYPLAAGATVTNNRPGQSWTIVNGSDPNYPQYNILKDGTALNVWGQPIGVHLFNIPASFIPDLNSQFVSDGLRQAFSDNGYPLLEEDAEIDWAVANQKWHVENSYKDMTRLQSGYVGFYIVNRADALHVCGWTLNIVRTGSDQTIEQVRIQLPTTRLTSDAMNDATTCPSGQKLKAFIAGQSGRRQVTWEQMMTANTPPRPPKCIPDPYHWCPGV